MLLTGVFVGGANTYAAPGDDSRTIAIVFDNSGSMYYDGIPAWCQATYAMEVFASMLNSGDVLQIYPMHPITVDGKVYTMEDPFVVTDASQAYKIREIYTEFASGTPIESVDCAIDGIQKANTDKKYVIVLTDGASFYKNDIEMSARETRKELDARFSQFAGKNLTMMYLGIGGGVVMPETAESEYFAKKQAVYSAEVLSALTDMCNMIFGRDILPENHISGNTIDFDISMKKLIVFVQGENVSDVSVTGPSGLIGQQLGSTSTKYSTAGCGNIVSIPDESLQGMMVTYADCTAGTYTIDYSGTATSIEVYYEPDADLDFVFTDASGNTVDPNALYEGDYKVSFGMKDAKTGQLIQSDLLGNPHYEGSLFINGEEHQFSYDGQSGEVPVALTMDDTFDARLTATYLSGYTITKSSKEFGWPDGGIHVAPRPAGEIRLEITGGDELYSLQNLEKGSYYTAKVYYQGELLTGKELEKVELRWDPDTSNAEVMEMFMEDHYDLGLFYKDPENPQSTVCGECTVTIYAHYTPKGSNEAVGQTTMTYNIEDDFSPLQMELIVPNDYIVIDEVGDNNKIIAKLTLNGAALTLEQFEATSLVADCSGINFEIVADANDSCYEICLKPTDGLEEGKYLVTAEATYIDNIGRATQVDDELTLTLSTIPLWLKWLIIILILIILFTIIWIVLHIKVLPKAHLKGKKGCQLNVGGEDVTAHTTFKADIENKQLKVNIKFAGVQAGVKMPVKPSKTAYLMKPSHKRVAEALGSTVSKMGSSNVKFETVTLGSTRFGINEDTGKLEQKPAGTKPFPLKHGMDVRISGSWPNAAGNYDDFNATVKLNFKK